MSILKEIQERRQQLQELSTKKLAQYVHAAAIDKNNLGHDSAKNPGSSDYEKQRGFNAKTTAKSRRRTDGIATALHKITGLNRNQITHREEVEHLEEGGNAENKFKKNVAVAKMGAKSNLVTGKDVDHEIMARSSHSSKSFAAKQVADSLKRSGRRELNRPSDSPIRATYKNGTYHAVHGKTGKVVDTNISDSGGRALSHVDHLNAQYRKGKLKLEELSPAAQALIEDAMKRRGRPKKRRNLAGEIIES